MTNNNYRQTTFELLELLSAAKKKDDEMKGCHFIPILSLGWHDMWQDKLNLNWLHSNFIDFIQVYVMCVNL